MTITIAGAWAGQEIVDKQTDPLFSNVVISDDGSPAPTETVTVTLSDAANGKLSNLGSGAYDPFAGEYLVSGSPAAVTAALNGLVFTPTIAPGVTQTTTFTIAVDDGLGSSATDSTTSVTATSTFGGGKTIGLTGAPGYAASLYGTDSDRNWDAVYGDSGTVFLADELAAVVGGGMSIVLSNSVVSLYQTAGDWDKISSNDDKNPGYDTISLNGAQASIVGGSYFLSFSGGAANAVSLYDATAQLQGSSGVIILNDAQVIALGDNQTVYFASGKTNEANLGGAWDTLFGSSGTIAVSGQASVVGGDDAISFASGATASLYQTSGHWDTVTGSRGAVILNGAQASVVGGGDTISLSNSADNAASLYQTAGSWDAVYGSGGAITLNGAQASVVGGNNLIYLSGDATNAVSLYASNGAADHVIGSNGTVTLNDAQAYVVGKGNNIYHNGFTNLLAFQPNIGTATVNGFGFQDVLQFSASDFADFAALHPVQQGADTVIALDADDSVRLVGVTASSLTAAQFSFV